MKTFGATRGFVAVMLSGSALIGGASAYAQTAMRSVATDTVEAITIQASKMRSPIYGAVLPGADAPRSATCEFWVQTDYLVRVQVALAGGDPMSGPTFYQPTRAPRTPNYQAAPLKAPGSELPKVVSMWEGREITVAQRGAATDPLFDGGMMEEAGGGMVGVSTALTGCQIGAYAGVDGKQAARVAYRDTTLRTGSALFDEGRYEEALGYYKQAAEKLTDQTGSDEASLMIGKIYLLALGDKSDPKQAITWLKISANSRFKLASSMPQFDPIEPHRNTSVGEAAVILANIYLGGVKGVAADPKEARKWFERARYVGHVPAAKILGDLCYYGIGGPKEISRAFNYYKEAATLGYAPAQYALAHMYKAGEVAGGPNLKQAVSWYEQAAKLEHPGATFALARAYDLGEGAPANPERALGLYKVSAVQGNIDAQAAVATYFYEGKAIPRDHTLARQWFQNAAIGGDADAMFNLGVMTMKGEGGDADLTKAWVWLKMSEKGGVEAAPNAVSVLERRMTSQQLQAAKGIYDPTKS